MKAAFQVLETAIVDVEVDPEAVGADFKFLVATEVGRVGLEKNFGDVAVPESVAAAVWSGVGKYGEFPVARNKFDVQGGGGPKQAGLGAALRVGIFPLPVSVEADWCSLFPGAGSREASGVERGIQFGGYGREARGARWRRFIGHI